MDASVYFSLSDRIDAACSLDELAAIRSDIDSVRPHAIERRALERRIERRERTILLPLVENEMPLLVGSAPSDRAAPAIDRDVARPRSDAPPSAPPLAG